LYLAYSLTIRVTVVFEVQAEALIIGSVLLYSDAPLDHLLERTVLLDGCLFDGVVVLVRLAPVQLYAVSALL
jgi:hypothetical protein